MLSNSSLFSADIFELWPLIRTFMLVVETGTLTHAGEKLDLSPAAVSKQMNRLEAKLKSTLFERSPRGLVATDTGQVFYQHCLQFADDLHHHFSTLRDEQHIPSGKLRILASHLVAECFVIKHISDFLHRFPKVTLNLDLAEAIPEFEEQNYDIIIGFGTQHGIAPWFRQKIIFSSACILCASPTYLRQHGTPTQLEHLQQHRFINHKIRSPINVIPFMANPTFTIHSPEMVINSTKTLLELCINHHGIAFLADFKVAEPIRLHQLQPLLPNFPLVTNPVNLFYRDQTYPDAKIKAFIETIRVPNNQSMLKC